MVENESFQRDELKIIHYKAKKTTEELGEISADIKIFPKGIWMDPTLYLVDRKTKVKEPIGGFPGSDNYQSKYNHRIIVNAFLNEKTSNETFIPFIAEVKSLVNKVLEEEELRVALGSEDEDSRDF